MMLDASTPVGEALLRAETAQPDINAFISIDRPGALARAAELDSTPKTAPLFGIPIGLKDLVDQTGHVTTCGSAFYRERAEVSATLVDRLEDAGGVIIGKTGLHEWAFGFSSENPHFGPVRNPWDHSLSVGGSSGGSAAAVAAGITPLAIGSDTGGSIRVPAALCGVFGLKVTHGRIPMDGVFPLVPSVDTAGPLADSLDLLESGYRVMAADVAPRPSPGLLRLAVPEPWVSEAPMSAEVADAFESTLGRLEEMGHTVSRVRRTDILPPGEIRAAISGEVARVHHRFRAQGLPYGADVEERIADAETITDAEIMRGQEWQITLRGAFAALFDEWDCVITPTVPVRQKTIGEDTLLGLHYRTVLSWFTSLVNQALLPAIAIPLRDSGAPPLSMQVIGRPGTELLLIAIARDFEAAELTGFTHPETGLAIPSSG